MKSFTDLYHSKFTAACLLWPCNLMLIVLCSFFPLSVTDSLCLYRKSACISEVKRASLVQPSAIHGSLSLPRLRNPMKRWAWQAGRRISDVVLLCLSQGCAALSQGPTHMFARHRGIAYCCWAGASAMGFAYFVLNGENGQICKWKRRRKNRDLCTCFRLEGSMRWEQVFESAHVWSWGVRRKGTYLFK